MRHAASWTGVLLAILLTPTAASPQVRGRISDLRTAEAVAGALVRLSGRTAAMVLTDDQGAYSFDRVRPGSYCIDVNHPGYEPARVCIGVGDEQAFTLDIPLRMSPVRVSRIAVAAERGRTATADSGGEGDRIAAAVLRQQSAAGAGSQASGALATTLLSQLLREPAPEQPGSRRPHALYVWGSAIGSGRVMLDGVTVNAPLHLGALLPTLNPHVVAAADLRSGGSSAQFDGGTTQIMEFTTRSAGSRAGLRGEMDMLAGSIDAEASLGGRGGVVASARRINGEVVESLLSRSFGYGYSDVLVRADWRVPAGGTVSATLFGTAEKVRLPRDLGEDAATWHNQAGTVGWRSGGTESRTSATAGWSSGAADLPLLSAPGGHVQARADRAAVGMAHHRRGKRTGWSAGGELEHLLFEHVASADADPESGTVGPVRCTVALPCVRAEAVLASAWSEFTLQPARAWSTRLGLRATHDGAGGLHLMPRASVTAIVTSRHAATLSAGRYSQPVLASPAKRDTAAAASVELAHATHVEAAFVRYGARSHVTAAAWLRLHEGMEGGPLAVPGVELSVVADSHLGLFSLGYSASSEPDPNDLSAPRVVRHLAALGLNSAWGRWKGQASAAWGSGLPMTSIVLEDVEEPGSTGPATGGLAPSLEPGRATASAERRGYTRLDASLAADFSVHAGARKLRITPYVRIINGLSQREALFYLRRSGSSPQPLARLPALPILGLRWEF